MRKDLIIIFNIKNVDLESFCIILQFLFFFRLRKDIRVVHLSSNEQGSTKQGSAELS